MFIIQLVYYLSIAWNKREKKGFLFLLDSRVFHLTFPTTMDAGNRPNAVDPVAESFLPEDEIHI